MINKIIVSLFFVCLLLSVSLALLGVERVELGPSVLAFMKNCSRELENFKIAIPNIPTIPIAEKGAPVQIDNWIDGLKYLFQEVSALRTIIIILNSIVSIINFVINIISTIIQLIEFVVIMIKNIIIFRDTLINSY